MGAVDRRNCDVVGRGRKVAKGGSSNAAAGHVIEIVAAWPRRPVALEQTLD